MSRKEREAVCLFIYMIRKIWSGYYEEQNRSKLLRHVNRYNLFFPEKMEDLEQGKNLYMLAANGYINQRNRPGPSSFSISNREMRLAWRRQLGSNYKCFENAPKEPPSIDYRDSVLFKKFKIKTNNNVGNRIKNNTFKFV